MFLSIKARWPMKWTLYKKKCGDYSVNHLASRQKQIAKNKKSDNQCFLKQGNSTANFSIFKQMSLYMYQ